MTKKKYKFRDPVIAKVVDKFVQRSDTGFKKYGTTLRDDPGDMLYWLEHLQEELMDAVNYVARLKEQVEIEYTPPTTTGTLSLCQCCYCKSQRDPFQHPFYHVTCSDGTIQEK